MDLTTIRNSVRELTDETVSTDPTFAMLNTFINYRYQDLVGRIMNVHQDFFGITDHTIDTVADQKEYSMPVDGNSRNKVKRIRRVEIAYDGTNYDIAYPIDLNDQNSTESDTETTYTQNDPRYYIFGDKIGFNPIPDANGTNNIKIWYIPRPDDLALDGDIPIIPVEYHQLLVYGAAADLKKRDENFTAAQNYEIDYETGSQKMVMEAAERQTQKSNAVKDISETPFLNAEDYVRNGSLS